MEEFEKARSDYQKAEGLDPAMRTYAEEDLAKLPPALAAPVTRAP